MHILIVAALVCYMLGFAGYSYAVARGRAVPGAASLFTLGFALHTLALICGFASERLGLLDLRADYYLVVAWGLALVGLVARRKFSFPALALLTSGLVLLCFFSSSVLAHLGGAAPSEPDPLVLFTHIVPALVGDVSLLVSFAAAALYLQQQRRLKAKDVSSLSGMIPPLPVLEQLLLRGLITAFVMFSLSTITGMILAYSVRRPMLAGDPLSWLTLATWALTALTLHLRYDRSWPVRRVARLTLITAGGLLAIGFALIFFGGNSFHGAL